MMPSRHIRLMVLGVATVAMAVAAWVVLDGVSQLRQARREAATAQAELNQMRSLLPVIEQRESHSREADVIRTRMEKAGFVPANWTQRRVQQNTTVVSRHEAEKILGQLTGTRSPQWFSANGFSVSVISPGAGLFSPALADDKGFSLEMSGVLYFPMGSQ